MPLIILLVISVFASISIYKRLKYEDSNYFKKTVTPYRETIRNKGVRGEYAVSRALERSSDDTTLALYNLYIPAGNGATTEIDTVFITTSGVFVIESKNYGGWIFGNNHSRYWCQTLPARNGSKKHKFYNPIWQNNTHIGCLKKLFTFNIPFYSVIVFSNRCTLKKVTVGDAPANVVYVRELLPLINRICTNEGVHLSIKEILQIYEMLQPYTHVTNEEKQQHINQIRQKLQ